MLTGQLEKAAEGAEIVLDAKPDFVPALVVRMKYRESTMDSPFIVLASATASDTTEPVRCTPTINASAHRMRLTCFIAYIAATADPEGTELASRLAGKRFGRSKVLDMLDRGFNDSAPLDGAPDALVEPGTGATDLLLKKLDAGGFSATSRNSARDLRDKADHLGIVWTKKHGRTRGLQRYGHVRSLVLSDAGRVFETAHRQDQLFGLAMLSQLRTRFQERHTDGSWISQIASGQGPSPSAGSHNNR